MLNGNDGEPKVTESPSSMEARRKEIAQGKLKVRESSSTTQPSSQHVEEFIKGKSLDSKHVPSSNSYALVKKKYYEVLEKEMFYVFSKLKGNVSM